MNFTDEEIRIKVAEACGWKRHDRHEIGFGAGQRLTTGWLRPDGIWVRKLPDYPEDLNACAEFEATLTEQERRSYFFHLFGTQKLEDGDLWKAVALTARQRCIAYLKTKGILP